jgi:multiple sugar transport system permease protein
MQRPTGRRSFRKAVAPYTLLAPAAAALLLFSLYPFLSGIWFSFTSVGWVGDQVNFAGLENYRTLLSGEVGAGKFFQDAAVRSVFWTATVVVGQLLMGLLTALVLNERFPGRALFRTAILAPIAVPTVILALTWQWMYDPFYGLINHYLNLLGLINGPTVWILQPNSSLWPLIVVGVWLGFPFMSLMLLSGLQNVPQELYEAAMVDGANQFQRFRDITLPQLRTVIAIAVMLHTLWWWNHFDILMILGSGAGQFGYGTMTLPILAWFEAFRWSHLARGAAISVVSMAVLTVVVIWNARRELRSVTG